MSRKKPLRAGIIGCGRIASTFDRDPKRAYVATHAGAYKRSKQFDLVAACDLDREKLISFGERWKVPQLYASAKKMLRNEKLDVLSICTWPETHFDLAQLAIKSGVKAVFCEKPITHKLSDADKLVSLSQKKKSLIAVNHSRRWDQGHLKIRDWIQSGKLGKIHHVNAYYTAGIANTGTHLFDLLNYFLGEAAWVQASPSPVFGKKDLTLSGMIYYKQNTLVSVAGLDVQDYLIFELDFYGSKGRLRITHSGFDLDYWKVSTSPYFSGYKELISQKSPIRLDKKKMMLNAVEDVAGCISKKRQPISSAQDGLKALELLCAFKESFKRNKKIALPLKNRKLSL